MANSVDPDQTAHILNSSVMLGSYLQQMTSADDIFFTWRFRFKPEILKL